MFDQKDLVTFFASRYFANNNKERKFEDWERRKLFGIVKHGNARGADGKPGQQPAQEDVEKRMAKMSLST
ncbi:hypothetical protein F5B18DRAFT_652958 [Nemania serpens]|nr:hypothetical protein F5B18DRAFT_652958 [Nemania serpens]